MIIPAVAESLAHAALKLLSFTAILYPPLIILATYF